jgi:hypothetical protein
MVRIPALSRKRKSSRRRLPVPDDLVAFHERQAAIRGRLATSLPVVGSAVTFLLVVTKILLVAGGDIGTALAIVDRAGPLSVLTGTFVTISPLLGVGLVGPSGA